MTARGEIFDALFQAAVLRRMMEHWPDNPPADSEWVREQQAEIVQQLNKYDHETADRVRARGRTWNKPHSVIWFVVGDWLDPEVTDER